MPRCRYCRKKFNAYSSLERFCEPEHAILWLSTGAGQNAQQKVKRGLKRKKKAEAKGLPHWRKETQKVVNQYIRLRDRDRPCITCGKWDYELRPVPNRGKWDAGHYRNVGSNPETRFYTLNIHKQCINCNQYKSGAKDIYKSALIERYGNELMDKLDAPRESKKYTIDDLAKMRRVFKNKIRKIEKRIKYDGSE